MHPDDICKTALTTPFLHFSHLSLPFERLDKYGVKMNPVKSTFGVTELDFASYTVNRQGIKPELMRVNSLTKLQSNL